MGRLINTTTMTVDGLVDVGAWYVADGDHDPASLSQFHGIAGLLLGRKTYEGLAAFWPHQQGPWADTLNPLPKYVASRTLIGALDWHATALEGDAIETVPKLKNDLDEDLVMSGCGDLARALLRHGLIDEIRFWVHPATGGDGSRPFHGEHVSMRLFEARPFDSGVVLLRYEPHAD